MTTFYLSRRAPLGEEIERLGPFNELILRPGSNWVEVRDELRWQTISLAGAWRVYVDFVDPNAPVDLPDPWAVD